MSETAAGSMKLTNEATGTTIEAGKPAPAELTIHLASGARWGGAQGPGPNADPTSNLCQLFRLAPMPIGSLRMEQETWEAMGTHGSALRFMSMRGDGARFLALSRAPEVEVVIHPIGRGIVAAMGDGRFADIELARLVGAVQDVPAPTLDDRALCRAYAVYLVAFADPKLSAAEVERMAKPWAHLSVRRPAGPVDEEHHAAALAALGSETSLVLPADLEIQLVPPKLEYAAAYRIGAEPHGDNDAPLSFNRFAEQLRAVMSPPST